MFLKSHVIPELLLRSALATVSICMLYGEDGTEARGTLGAISLLPGPDRDKGGLQVPRAYGMGLHTGGIPTVGNKELEYGLRETTSYLSM